MNSPRYVAIANREGLRWQAYETELRAFWQHRGVEVNLTVVPWSEVIARRGRLDSFSALDTGAIVRLESPGRDWGVAQQLLRLGSELEQDEVETDWLNLEYRRGHLVRPGLFFAGFRHILQHLRDEFASRPHLRPTACPVQVAEMFDKNAASQRLHAAGVSVPDMLASAPDPEGLIAAVRQLGYDPAYVKLNSGSSASAIAVLHTRRAVHAVSSVLLHGGEFYSTRRLETYLGEPLHRVLGFLIREGVHVQQGIPMAQLDGENFDVRVIVLYGQVVFTIFRLSTKPMTNLHLGGRRGEVAACRAAIPTRAWLDGLDHCVMAAAQYPDSAMVGVDLLFERGYCRSYVLEVNAFGDFFPNLTDDQGRSVHRVEIEETARRMGLISA